MANLTTAQAAQRLGVSVRRVQALIKSGHLEATRFGKAWLIEEGFLQRVAVRKPGRPRKKG